MEVTFDASYLGTITQKSMDKFIFGHVAAAQYVMQCTANVISFL